MSKSDDLKQRAEDAIADIEEEYRKDNGDLFIFLFSYFYPRIETKSDYIRDAQGRYQCLCHFMPSGRKIAKTHLELFAEYFGIDIRVARYNFSAYIDVHSIKILNTCTDEEYGDHFSFYGEDSDYYFVPVKTALALADPDVRAVVEEKQGCEYALVMKVMELLLKKAADTYERLAAEEPDEYENRLASALYRLGEIYEQTDRTGEAIEVWQWAYSIWYKLEEANPDFRSEEYNELTDKVGDLLEI